MCIYKNVIKATSPASFLVLPDGHVKVFGFEEIIAGILVLSGNVKNLIEVLLQKPVEIEIVRMVGENVLAAIKIAQTKIGGTI